MYLSHIFTIVDRECEEEKQHSLDALLAFFTGGSIQQQKEHQGSPRQSVFDHVQILHAQEWLLWQPNDIVVVSRLQVG